MESDSHLRPKRWLIAFAIVVVGVLISFAVYFYAFSYVETSPGHAAQVSTISASCSGDPETCALTLRNTGSADGETTSNCSLTFGGTTHTATSTVQTIKPDGPTVLVTCTASAGTAPPGSKISGLIHMANGATVVFQFPPAG